MEEMGEFTRMPKPISLVAYGLMPLAVFYTGVSAFGGVS